MIPPTRLQDKPKQQKSDIVISLALITTIPDYYVVVIDSTKLATQATIFIWILGYYKAVGTRRNVFSKYSRGELKISGWENL